MQEEIKKVIEEIRLGLQADGGDIELVDVQEGVVKVRLKGACAGCPMSQMTMTSVVEQRLKEKVPGIKKVKRV